MNGTSVERIAEVFVQRAIAEVGQPVAGDLVRGHVRSLILDWWESTPGLTAGEARQILSAAWATIKRGSIAPMPALPLAPAA